MRDIEDEQRQALLQAMVEHWKAQQTPAVLAKFQSLFKQRSDKDRMRDVPADYPR